MKCKLKDSDDVSFNIRNFMTLVVDVCQKQLKNILKNYRKKYGMPTQEVKKYFAGARIIKRNECIIDAKKIHNG